MADGLDEQRVRELDDESLSSDDSNSDGDGTSSDDLDSAHEIPMGTSISHSDSSSNGGDEESPAPRIVTFNRTLPASHQYLGNDLEDVQSGQTVLEPYSVVDSVPILPVPNFILMPNQILPLNNFHPRIVAMFRTIIANSSLFGVVNIKGNMYNEPEEGETVAKVGTLSQVLAYKEETESEITSMKLRVVGRQRFRLLETYRQMDSILLAKIRVLPDIELNNFLHTIEPTCSTSSILTRCLPSDRRNALFKSTPVPSFVYDQYDVKKVIAGVTEELKRWHDVQQLETVAENSTAFSFWVASNLPIDDATKLFILSLDCDLQRLRYELSLLKRCTTFCCRKCHTRIGRKSDVFSMSVTGPLGVYVNPNGLVHETLTLLRVESNSVQTVGRSSSEYSWFPGYAWSALQCSRCHSHTGWRFNVEKGQKLKPKEFWGITRKSIVPILVDQGADHEDDGWVPFM